MMTVEVLFQEELRKMCLICLFITIHLRGMSSNIQTNCLQGIGFHADHLNFEGYNTCIDRLEVLIFRYNDFINDIKDPYYQTWHLNKKSS